MKRRVLEVALLAFGATFLVLVGLSFRGGNRATERSERRAPVPPARDAGPATSLSSGFDFTESVKGKPLFRIKADKTAGFGATAIAGGSPELYAGEKVLLTLYPEDGQPVEIRADKAEYDARTRAAKLEGNVRWDDARGALAETNRVFFRADRRTLEIPGPLHISRGGFDLRSRSGHFEAVTRTLTLAGPIEGTGSDAARAPFSSLGADAAVYQKDEGLIALSGHVHAASGEGDSLESDRLDLKLAEPEQRLEWARASGSVRGLLAGRRLPGENAAASPYSGDEAAFLFDAAGDLQSLTLTGAPAAAEEGDRKVTASTIDLKFANRRAVSAVAHGNVTVVAGEDRAFAQNGELAFGADGAASALTLSGQARLEGPNRSGRADRATQVPGEGIWILTGSTGSSATVEQDGSRVSAPRIAIDDRRKLVRAEGGDVRALLAPARDSRANPTLVGDPTRPTYGKAQRMTIDQAARTATLSGGAALWQDASSLFGRDVTLNDAERSVVAVGDARAVLAPDPAAAKADSRRATVVTGQRLIYREVAGDSSDGARGTVDLDGDVTAVRGGWRANARSGTVRIGGDRKPQQVELCGDVSLSDSTTGRTAQAEHALDFPADERTILEGNPARVRDRDGSRVAGATLTITDHGRRVEVTAPEGGKTETIHQTRRDR